MADQEAPKTPPLNPDQAERIVALNVINENVTSLLRAAGLAVAALTNKPLDPGAAPLSGDAYLDRQTAFRTCATQYFKLCLDIKAALLAEAAALKDDGLLPARRPKKLDGDDAASDWLGGLNIGVLNSRGGHVATRKEREVWSEVRGLLGAKEKGKVVRDVSMDGAREAENSVNGHESVGA